MHSSGNLDVDDVGTRPIHRLTGFQRDLLYVVVGTDRPSGQIIKEILEEQTATDVTHGRLYPNLDTLVTRGLVSKGQLDRRTNYYAATEAGVAALRSYHDWGTERLQ